MMLPRVFEGSGPILLGQPHAGTFVPEDLIGRLNVVGRALADTDWHIPKLYDGLLADCTVVASDVHRYVIDANRDPAGGSLYPGQNTTGLCPQTDFDGRSIWKEGQEPSADEIYARCAAFHAPYHQAIEEQLSRIKALHGVAILYDCHSIRSNISFLFEGTLPVFNIGTNLGTTCDTAIETSALEACMAANPDQTVLNGRFKGGWTTRHYGKPADGIHAIQMETAQRAYMEEAAPWTYRRGRADQIRPVLSTILNTLDRRARSGALGH